MAVEIIAEDGGQERALILGEKETIAWRADNLADGDSLATSTYVIEGDAVTAEQAFLVSPEVGYRITAAEAGTSTIEVALHTALGDTIKHRLSIDVAVPLDREESALVVEDGTGSDPTANSYASHTDLLVYAANRGYDWSSYTVGKLDALMFAAMDYIEAQGARLAGERSASGQPLQGPRTGVYINNVRVSDDEILRAFVYAQLALAIEADSHELMPTITADTKGAVIRERIEGAVDVSYAQGTAAVSTPRFPRAEAWLSVLYKPRQMYAIRA